MYTDMYFSVAGRIFIVVDKDLFEDSQAGKEVRKTAIALADRGHSVFIICEYIESSWSFETHERVRFARVAKDEMEVFFQVFKPGMLLAKVKRPEAWESLRLAKLLKVPVGGVPGSSNVPALDTVSRRSRASLNLTNKKTYEEPVVKRFELTREPTWFNYSVRAHTPHVVKATVIYSDAKESIERGCVARIVYVDANGRDIPGPYSGVARSKLISDFVYLPPNTDQIIRLMPPRNAVKVEIGLHKWNAKSQVYLADEPSCEVLGGEKRSVLRSGKAAISNTQSAIELKDLKVAGILDEFTAECFQHEVKLNLITPDNWLQSIKAERPDLLFVESCWFGNGNTWSGLIFGYTSNGANKMDELIALIEYCRTENIPTVFWAKEDPVHFSRFAPTAKLFDYVFTTDSNMVPEYESQYGIEAESLSFFCQPKVHNPIQSIPRNKRAAFAGSYYSDKKERCENFHTIMDALENASIDVDIYDRCFDRGLAHFTFPDKFGDKVIGSLKPEEMWRAYKGYRYTVNLNTVKHSPTMFARRVYESLASGTPVISNYSQGVITQFGGIVCASDNDKEILDFLDKLQDEATYQNVAKLGAREALGRHTLADRLESVCARLGINVKPHLPLANLEITASTEQEVEQAINLFEQQTYLRKKLIVNLENSNVLYPYLNRNSDEEVFRVKTEFAKPLSGITVEHTIGDSIEEFALEDAAIATQYASEIQQVSKEAPA